jgi:alkylation response protein AidB-like acyl-CoA dehydrogenase
MIELPDPAEVEVVEALGDFLAKEAPLARSLQASQSATGFDRPLLEQLSSLGLFRLSSSSEAGGLGLSQRLVGACCAQAGRVLLGGPWFEQLLAARLLETTGAAGLLDEGLPGSVVVSLPLAASAWRNPPQAVVSGARARFVSGSCVLGFADGVDAWLVPAGNPVTGATVLVWVRPEPARARPRRGFSVLWREFDVQLADAEGEVVGELDPGRREAHLLDLARLLALVSVGATAAVLESATEYAKLREQFGRPVGSFQSLQHRLAGVFIDLEHVKSLAAATLDPAERAQLDQLVPMAKVAADRLAVSSAGTALQVHGGLGFTWELPVHHYLKEALRRRTVPQPTAVYRGQLHRQVLSYIL